MPLTRLIGVYNADGGVVGETRYIIGHLLGLTSCSLCDITHSPLRRKPEWDAMVATLVIPLEVLHRNETSPELSNWLDGFVLPVVVAVDDRGAFQLLLDAETLDHTAGSVAEFETLLTRALESF
jgi:hypothetical protein